MLYKIEIKNSKLAQINLIVEKNNIGKIKILELINLLTYYFCKLPL